MWAEGRTEGPVEGQERERLLEMKGDTQRGWEVVEGESLGERLLGRIYSPPETLQNTTRASGPLGSLAAVNPGGGDAWRHPPASVDAWGCPGAEMPS